MKKRMILLMTLLFSLPSAVLNNQCIVIAKEDSSLISGVSGCSKILSDSVNNSLKEVNNHPIFRYGFTTANVNARKEANIDADILDIIPFNTCVNFCNYNDEWVEIRDYSIKGEYIEKVFVKSEYVTVTECFYTVFNIENKNIFKSYMDYRAITNRRSLQYLIQKQYAHTGNYGIRMVSNRYCVAIGTAFNVKVGVYFDLILENGVTIPCIVSDIKAKADTESNNISTKSNGCVSEFIVDSKKLNPIAKVSGDISSCCNEWNSPVRSIKVYDKYIF